MTVCEAFVIGKIKSKREKASERVLFCFYSCILGGGGCRQLFRGARNGVSSGRGGRAEQQLAVGWRDDRCVSLQQLHDGPGVR